MTNIQINDESIRSAVSAAILQQLNTDNRDAILQQAVTYLITPPKDIYGRAQPTPLQVAMNEAVARVVHRVANELIEQDEALKANIRDIATSALSKLTDADWDTRTIVIDGIVEVLRQKMAD